MEKALEEAAKICPRSNVSEMILSLYNITKYVDKDQQLASFACHYTTAFKLFSTVGYWNGSFYMFGFAFGLPSALLAIVTFYRKEFDTVSFFYHRVINIIELVYMIFIFECALGWMREDARSKSWLWSQYMTYFHYKLDLALPLAIEMIIIWIAIERVAVCFTTYWFQKINQKSTAYFVVIASLIISILIYFPTAFTNTFVHDNITQKYTRTDTNFVKSSSFRVYIRFWAGYSFIRFGCMVCATVATIIGLVRISKRKRKLIGSAGSKSMNGKQLMRQIIINKQLCLLQLCESIPVLSNCLILLILQSISYTMDPKQLVSMPYEQAISNLQQFELFEYLGTTQTVVDQIEHCTHFYRYLIFSQKVQKAVVGMFKKNSVSAITANTVDVSKFP